MNRIIRIDTDNYAGNKLNITKKIGEFFFYGLDLLSKLQVIKELLRIEKNTPMKKEQNNSFQKVYIAYRISLMYSTYYRCYRKINFFKIKIDKILHKNYYVTEKTNKLTLLLIEKKFNL